MSARALVFMYNSNEPSPSSARASFFGLMRESSENSKLTYLVWASTASCLYLLPKTLSVWVVLYTLAPTPVFRSTIVLLYGHRQNPIQQGNLLAPVHDLSTAVTVQRVTG
ncbi:hypothetical protein BU17DRAFT_71123 [Hysterangium stoloniferum]|nr:hypothetical protein BU17DRAFT_71123 [Hysterangium stoloniferum]